MPKQQGGRHLGVNRSLAGDILVFAVLACFGAFMLLPFIYAIAQSVKPIEEIFVFPPRFLANHPTTENYRMLSHLTDSLWIPFSRYAANSIFVTVVGTLLNLIVASMAAFPLAKYKFPGSGFLFNIVVMALLFTGPVTALPQYIVVAKTQLINTPWAVILPTVALPLGLFLMKNFMTQINDAMLEAARIDGAGIFRVFVSICMPLVKPASFTLVIFSFQSLWNSTGGAYVYEEELKLLPTILNQIATAGMSRVGPGAAAAVLMMIPSFLIFVLLQSRIIETMAFSGIKG